MVDRGQGPGGGWLEGKTHVFPVRVYYEDTDFSGVVYHANYLRFMERGRSEFLRISGAGHQDMFAGTNPLVWAVRRMMIDFAGARMRRNQSVARMGDILVKATVEVCIITLDGRPRRVPDSTRKKLEI